MRITESHLRRIIREEVSKVLLEAAPAADVEQEIQDAIAKYYTEPRRWRHAKSDFEAWADGERDDVRRRYYTWWSDEDFQRVLTAMA